MTEAKLKRIYSEVAADWFCRGGKAVCDILEQSLADMPDQDAMISVRDFMVAVATARQAVINASREQGPNGT